MYINRSLLHSSCSFVPSKYFCFIHLSSWDFTILYKARKENNNCVTVRVKIRKLYKFNVKFCQASTALHFSMVRWTGRGRCQAITSILCKYCISTQILCNVIENIIIEIITYFLWVIRKRQLGIFSYLSDSENNKYRFVMELRSILILEFALGNNFNLGTSQVRKKL